ncbi:helix-turn-helix domain-containing protein [Nitrosopumilus sp.]|uniref:helix-turn-helix domain-containing protein n=1 Tax=Nitrosopumilus sp. TaxID=2024843 RepID=UPI002639C7B8|nr:helix-turn-helix domain-containing protein [Nitrosopumilus sp.]
MEISQIENALISEIKLTPYQARVYLLVTCNGKMNAQTISEKLSISLEDANETANDLMKIGAFIDITETEFEAMHPRFTAVNMYRRMCERENLEFKRNKIVDNIGVFLEKPFDDARTK